MWLKQLQKQLLNQQITVDASPEAIALLGKKGFDPVYGARPLKRVIQKEILNELSKSILNGKVKTDSVVLIDCFKGHIVFKSSENFDIKI